MDQDVSGNILTLTLEIIYLLTGENYGPMKKKYGGPPPPFLTPERNIDKKILEVIQKIIELLTGEVPIRCQDVSVYFSMEEWEYLEGHRDLYKDVMMENRPPLTSLDSPSSNCPNEDPIIVIHPFTDQSSSAEDQKMTHTMENITKASNSCEEGEEGFSQCDISETTHHTLTTIVKEELFPAEEHFLHPVDSTTTHTLSAPADCKVETFLVEEHLLHPVDSTTHSQSTPADCKVETLLVEEHLLHPVDSTTTHTQSAPADCKVETLLVEEHLLHPDISTLTQPTQYPSAHFKEDPFPYEEPPTPTELSLNACSPATHDQGEYVPVFYPSCYLDQSKDPQEPRAYNKPFACFECNMFFRDRSELVAHQRSHPGQKPYRFTSSAGLDPPHPGTTSYSCADCGKFFSTYSNLSLHRKIHLGVKPYSCPECGKCFLRNSHLTRHRQSHVGDRVKPYSCTECGKSFLSRSSFVVHWRNHTGENPYSCSECGKSFPAYSCLVQHWRVHTGEKPYPCSECGKRFAAYSNLTLHHRIHTGEKPYCCSECGKRFVRNSHLRRHRKCHTGEESHLCDE